MNKNTGRRNPIWTVAAICLLGVMALLIAESIMRQVDVRVCSNVSLEKYRELHCSEVMGADR